MKIYLMIMAWLVVLILLGTIVSALVMCCCDPRSKGEGSGEPGNTGTAQKAGWNSANEYEIEEDDENDTIQQKAGKKTIK